MSVLPVTSLIGDVLCFRVIDKTTVRVLSLGAFGRSRSEVLLEFKSTAEKTVIFVHWLLLNTRASFWFEATRINQSDEETPSENMKRTIHLEFENEERREIFEELIASALFQGYERVPDGSKLDLSIISEENCLDLDLVAFDERVYYILTPHIESPQEDPLVNAVNPAYVIDESKTQIEEELRAPMLKFLPVLSQLPNQIADRRILPAIVRIFINDIEKSYEQFPDFISCWIDDIALIKMGLLEEWYLDPFQCEAIFNRIKYFQLPEMAIQLNSDLKMQQSKWFERLAHLNRRLKNVIAVE